MNVLMLDVDGVLVHNEADEFVRDVALDATLATARSRVTAEQWLALGTGRADLVDVLTNAMQDRELAERLVEYGIASETHIDPIVLADVERIRAKGLRVYLATNQESRRAAYLVDRLGLGDRIDGMLHSAALGARKPDRAFFEAATRAAKVAVHDVVFIDDNAGNVDAARRFGWRATHWLGDLSLEDAISAAR
jgi:putative hydrolase of the HAD superfamily